MGSCVSQITVSLLSCMGDRITSSLAWDGSCGTRVGRRQASFPPFVPPVLCCVEQDWILALSWKHMSTPTFSEAVEHCVCWCWTPSVSPPPPPSASSTGSLELVDLLLKNGAAPVCQRGTGLSPLHLACQAGHLPVLQRLLKVSYCSRTVLCSTCVPTWIQSATFALRLSGRSPVLLCSVS